MTRNAVLVRPIALALVLLTARCKGPEYVPRVENITTSTYGAAIEIKRKSVNLMVDGELISIHDSLIVILSEEDKKKTILEVQTTDVSHFRLRYAQPKKYGWAIPLYSLASLSHGYYAALTLPLNLIVTGAVAASGSSAFTYNDKQITLQELSVFARFPQGIPPKITYQMLEATEYNKEDLNFEADENAGINGSFEINKANLPVNWYLLNTNNSSGEGLVQINTSLTNPADGKLSLQIKAPTFQKNEAGKPSIGQILLVNPNSSYTIRFKVRSAGLVLRAKAGGLNDETDDFVELETNAKSDTWISYELNIKTGPAQERLRLEFSAVTTGTANLDAVEVIENEAD